MQALCLTVWHGGNCEVVVFIILSRSVHLLIVEICFECETPFHLVPALHGGLISNYIASLFPIGPGCECFEHLRFFCMIVH
jgi:hypothetical protein